MTDLRGPRGMNGARRPLRGCPTAKQESVWKNYQAGEVGTGRARHSPESKESLLTQEAE